MAFFDELLLDLLKPTSPKDADQDARIDALTKDVAQLRRAVGVLTQMLYENDAFSMTNRDQIRNRLASALRVERDDDEPIPEGDTTKCGSCGKMLFEDDPELTLQSKGRVCMSCFQRGG
jgi:hypothetical protein